MAARGLSYDMQDLLSSWHVGSLIAAWDFSIAAHGI